MDMTKHRGGTPLRIAKLPALQRLAIAAMAGALGACGGGGGTGAASAGASATAAASSLGTAVAVSSGGTSSTSALTTGSGAASSATSPAASAPVAAAATASFQVNAATSDLQLYPAVARTKDGGYVVAWVSIGQAVCSRPYRADGTPIASQTCVPPDAAAGDRPAIAALDDGSYVVAWSAALGNNSWALRSQHFSAAGAPVGSIQAIPTASGVVPEHVTAAGLAGGYVLGWTALQSTAETTSIVARRFANDDTPLGVEQLVDAAASGVATMPAVSKLADGGYTFAWNAGGAVVTRRYAADGTAMSGETTVATDAIYSQQRLGVAGLAGGGWVVAWNANGAAAVRRYGADGSALDAETLVEPPPPPDPAVTCGGSPQGPVPCQVTESSPNVAALDDGGFVVGYQYLGLPSTDDERVIHARRYASSGTAAGSAARVSDPETTVGKPATWSAVAPTAGGGFVFAWSYQSADANVFARQFAAQGLVGSGS